MPLVILLALATAGVLAYEHFFKSTPPSAKIVAQNALVPGHWYRVTVFLIPPPIVGPPVPLDVSYVTTTVSAELKAQGFLGALAVLPSQNVDQSWSATATGPYTAGQGSLASTTKIHVQEVEEVQAPSASAVAAATAKAPKTSKTAA